MFLSNLRRRANLRYLVPAALGLLPVLAVAVLLTFGVSMTADISVPVSAAALVGLWVAESRLHGAQTGAQEVSQPDEEQAG